MNNTEFLQEVKTSSFCSPDFEEIYNDFCHYQKLTLDTLIEIDRICKKNEIPYQLAYGSLLGAVRDGGQIPWDYDVDIFIPYHIKDIFIDALKRDLSDKYYFYCPEINNKCRHFFIRVTPMGYRSEVLHVDVFYTVGAPKDEDERKEFAQKLLELNTIRFNKLVIPKEEATGNKLWKLKLWKAKIKAVQYDLNEISNEYNVLCTKYSGTDSEYYISSDSFGWKRSYTFNEMHERILYTTRNGEFYISANYDSILNKIYGNYLEIPPLEKRIKELISSYRRVKYFEGKRIMGYERKE